MNWKLHPNWLCNIDRLRMIFIVEGQGVSTNKKQPGDNACKLNSHHQTLCLMFCTTTIMKWHVLKPNYAFLGELEVGDSC